MAFDADTLLDRMQLKRQVARWRTLAIAFAVLASIIFIGEISGVDTIESDHIARIVVSDIITDDLERKERLQKLKENDNVKAVFVHLDTPGGTAYGGEQLYQSLREIAEVKPVISLMRTICTSAGYMAALGGTHIMAQESTLTGSIGVIMQSFQATKLAENIGIEPVIVKSAENKAVPNPLEKLNPKQRQIIQSVVDDYQRFFLTLVSSERSLSKAEIQHISDGRIFTGKQALQAKLIDGLGGESEARTWLKEHHDISETLDIRDSKPKANLPEWLSDFENMIKNTIFSSYKPFVTLDGLLLIWQPALR